MIYFCPACYGMRQENKGFYFHFLSASYLFFLLYSITGNHIDTALLSKTRIFVSIHLSGVTSPCFWYRIYSNSVP